MGPRHHLDHLLVHLARELRATGIPLLDAYQHRLRDRSRLSPVIDQKEFLLYPECSHALSILLAGLGVLWLDGSGPCGTPPK
jgi:hypothetical protein